MTKSEKYRMIGRSGPACCPNHGGSHKVEDGSGPNQGLHPTLCGNTLQAHAAAQRRSQITA